MARYLPLDEMDLVYVLKKHNIHWEKIVSLWGEALKNSSRSDKSREFRDHVFDFLKHKGKKVWGDAFKTERAIEKFKAAAGVNS